MLSLFFHHLQEPNIFKNLLNCIELDSKVPVIIYMTWAHYGLMFEQAKTMDGVVRELGGLASVASALSGFLLLAAFSGYESYSCRIE